MPKAGSPWAACTASPTIRVDAEKAYNNAIEAEPDNEEALTGLAMLYSDLGDNKRAIEKLKAGHRPAAPTSAP